MMPSLNLIIRTDANVAIGTGHVMRCLALAQACQDEGGHAVFVMADSTPAVEERLRSEGFEIVRLEASPGSPADCNRTVEIAGNNATDWVVIDGYHFGAEYQRIINAARLKVLAIDDNGHAEHYCADIVLNQNLHASELLYLNHEPHTRLLLGTRYAMLRREFKSWRAWKREISPIAHKVLVTLGGSDPGNVTQVVVDALCKLDRDDVIATVVAGGSTPRLNVLQAAIAQAGMDIRFVVNATKMAELLAATDLAVSGAGSTCWEMCFMGVPAIILDVADNQQELARRLNEVGAAIHLPSSEITATKLAGEIASLIQSREARQDISQKARELVDGKGGDRVLAALTVGIRLRRTQPSDCRFLWEWANDPEVRSMSFSAEPIPWGRHVEWFTSKLSDPSAILYVATDETEHPVGQVRCDVYGRRAVLSLNLGPQFRGKGWGRKMLLLAKDEIFRDSDVDIIDAFVKPDNEPSLRLFEGLGFYREGLENVQGQQAVHFVLTKNSAE